MKSCHFRVAAPIYGKSLQTEWFVKTLFAHKKEGVWEVNHPYTLEPRDRILGEIFYDPEWEIYSSLYDEKLAQFFSEMEGDVRVARCGVILRGSPQEMAAQYREIIYPRRD